MCDGVCVRRLGGRLALLKPLPFESEGSAGVDTGGKAECKLLPLF